MQEKIVRSSERMSDSAYIDDAADFAKALTLADMVRAGDYGNAMRRVSRRVGVGYSVLKHLHYSAPKRVETADFVRLGTAYGKQRKAGKAAVEFVPRTALARLVVGMADALDRGADALDSAASKIEGEVDQ